jgi:two-component system OmpR family response regulator
MPAKKTSRVKETGNQRSHLNPTHRILVVDDDEDIRRLNTEVLVNSGYRVDGAADGAMAWDALQLNDYDLLLTDHGMPNVNGLSLIKKLRAAHKTIPVILVSGTAPAKGSGHSWLQIDSTLPKPYTLDELVGAVGKVLHATCGIAGQAGSFPTKNLNL